MALLRRKKWLVLPNTAGCYSADEAVRALRLAREPGNADMVKLRVLGDKDPLNPKNEETPPPAKPRGGGGNDGGDRKKRRKR